VYKPKNGSRSSFASAIFFKVKPLATIEDFTLWISCGGVENRQSRRSRTMAVRRAEVLQGLNKLRKKGLLGGAITIERSRG
jgi:hypothetical protein